MRKSMMPTVEHPSFEIKVGKSYFLVIELPDGSWRVPMNGEAILTQFGAFSAEFWPKLCALPEVKALLQEFGGVFVPSEVNG